MQRGRYLKFHQYLYLLRCVSPDVTDILSRMSNICLKTTSGWGGHYLCGLFYCCSRLCPVLPVSNPLSCCYLHLVILVIPICVSRLSQMLSDLLIVT